MSEFLSFADRERLLQSLDQLSADSADTPWILSRVADWAISLKPKYGFEHSLLRNVTLLSNYLREHAEEKDIVDIARGSLRFVLGEQLEEGGEPAKEPSQDSQKHFVLSQAYVASYAVHEISLRLDQTVAYNPPSITKAEQAKAEEMFERLSDETVDDDGLLIESVKNNLLELENLAACGFLRRLVTNASSLIGVLEDPRQPEEHRSCARGALLYLVEDNDAINDDLGLIGYLDDYFIVQLALDLVSPQREPFVELLDEVVTAWPFLNMLSINDGSGSRPASEFMILNSALSCKRLRSPESLNTMLIAPKTGPIAMLLGFIKTLGLAQDSSRQDITESTFREGQKVLVDYSAVAEFAGYKVFGGRKRFGLRQYTIDHGQRLPKITYWPLSDLCRLVPAKQCRTVRGKITHDLNRKEDTLLSGLDYLFVGESTANFQTIAKKVIVVMPTALAAQFCKSALLYGQRLKDVVPIGHLSSDAEAVEPWSNRFGAQPPILIFVSDLDYAREYAEEHSEQIALVVVDVKGRNTEKHASLKRLARLKIPYLLVTSERVADETELEQHGDLSIWEWGPDDLAALVWPETANSEAQGEIAKFEQRVKSTITGQPMIEPVLMPVMTETYKAFLRLRHLARHRGSERLADLEDMVSLAFFAMTHLMRCATPLTDNLASLTTVREQVSKVESITKRCNYLSGEEQKASSEFTHLIAQLVTELCEENPKAKAMLGLLKSHPKATVVCPDARLVSELTQAYGNKQVIIAGNVAETDDFHGGLILPGWFRRSRMAAVLSPLVADPVVLLLYEVECQWYRSFALQRQKSRDERRALSRRSAIFPKMTGWSKPKPPKLPKEEPEADSQEIEEIRAEVFDHYKSRIYEAAKAHSGEADAKARLVLFTGGSYGLFTDNYKLNIVTHLIDNAVAEDNEKACVKLVSANEAKVGDAILFRHRSRDLIREVADTLLEPGTRELSSLWRKPLQCYVENQQITPEQLCTQLKQAGCEIGLPAVLNWLNDDCMIAPMRYRKDVPAIAKVTGDSELTAKLDSVLDAIKKVRSAHQQKAPRLLAKRIRERAIDIIQQEQIESTSVKLDDGFVIVRVSEVVSELIPVNYSSANQLTEGNTWLG